MVMELDKVIEIVDRLSSKKSPDRNSVISRSNFSSIAYDRFYSELSKHGLKWDGEPISIENLVNDSRKEPLKISQSNIIKNPLKNNQHGIGIDIQSLSDFPETVDFWKDEFYISKFSKKEISYAIKRKNPIQTFCGIFAAKEAIFKSTGTELSKIEIFWDDGKPFSHLSYISISHDNSVSVAVAISHQFNLTGIKSDSVKSSSKSYENETITINEFENPKNSKSHHFSKIHFFLTLITLLIMTYLLYQQI